MLIWVNFNLDFLGVSQFLIWFPSWISGQTRAPQTHIALGTSVRPAMPWDRSGSCAPDRRDLFDSLPAEKGGARPKEWHQKQRPHQNGARFLPRWLKLVESKSRTCPFGENCGDPWWACFRGTPKAHLWRDPNYFGCSKGNQRPRQTLLNMACWTGMVLLQTKMLFPSNTEV